MSRKLIVLAGRKRTGKGTFFNTATSLYSGVGEFFYAKPIKDFCINALGLSYEQMYGSTEQRESPTLYRWGTIAAPIREKWKKDPAEFLTARQVLQVIGTEIMRDQFDPDVWSRAASLEAIRSKADICIFTDARMGNEITIACKSAIEAGFDRPAVIRIYRESGLEDGHITECSLDNYDALPNQRSLDKGIPSGFQQVSERLWRKVSGDNLFDFLLDNNGNTQEMEKNTKLVLCLLGLSAPVTCAV